MRSRREMDAWEALDIDDSDLPSLLRPCKRQVCTISSSSGSPQPVVGSHPPASTTSSPLIPGPAGALQAAFMQRKTHLHSPLPTQDYLRRVAQEGFPDDDHDFKHHHWLLALDFVRRQGTIEETPLSFMRKCLTADRVPLVVAIIKSSTPNALGDLMVTLKFDSRIRLVRLAPPFITKFSPRESLEGTYLLARF